jgi:hypothetical protein
LSKRKVSSIYEILPVRNLSDFQFIILPWSGLDLKNRYIIESFFNSAWSESPLKLRNSKQIVENTGSSLIKYDFNYLSP